MAKEDFWPDFSKEMELVDADCGVGTNLSYSVLRQYGIDFKSTLSEDRGGLKNIDIKHMDALTVIKHSLLDYAGSTGGLYEPIVDEDGDVNFIKIGANSGNITDIYYRIDSESFIDDVAGVMVTGGKPIPTRRAAGFVPIWGEGDTESKIVYDTQAMKSSCLLNDFKQHCTIVFNDPHLDEQYKDGIDAVIFDLEDPWDRIIGYVYYQNPGPLATKDTTITYNETCEVPICLGPFDSGVFVPGATSPDMGTLVRAPVTGIEDLSCFVGLGGVANPEDGIEVPLDDKLRFTSVRGSTVDKYLGISQVFLIGYELDRCGGNPISDALAVAGNLEINTKLGIMANKPNTVVTRLEEGNHYSIVYELDTEFKAPHIVFGNVSRQNDNAKYGSDAEFSVLPGCGLSLYLESVHGIEEGSTLKGTIFPTGGQKGIWVHQIWAVVSLDTHSIDIFDPNGNADDIAEELEFELAPLIINEQPAPIGFKGKFSTGPINLEDSVVDHDPTTTQKLQETDFETKAKEMEGGGLTLSLSYLDEDGSQRLAEVLYEYMNSRTGIETTYICGPNCEPKLGGLGLNGGIVNNISYSYSDSGSYTISVNEGPWVLGGFSDVSGGLYMKQTEEVTMEGTIIQDAGNHVNYKVRLDGLGERWAINGCAKVLRVGDKVSCAVHNNPVEA